MRHPLPSTASRADERGASLSVLVVVVMMALFLVAGLVVDGGAKVSAVRRAESVAAHAARAGADAGAVGRAAGTGVDVGAVRAASAGVLAERGVAGDVVVEAGEVRVTTRVEERTVFLSAIGIDAVAGTGDATAVLVR